MALLHEFVAMHCFAFGQLTSAYFDLPCLHTLSRQPVLTVKYIAWLHLAILTMSCCALQRHGQIFIHSCTINSYMR